MSAVSKAVLFAAVIVLSIPPRYGNEDAVAAVAISITGLCTGDTLFITSKLGAINYDSQQVLPASLKNC